MYYECCVCKRLRQDAILYHFPCSEKRRNEWLKCLNRDDLKGFSQEKLSKLFVCQKHFEKRFLTTKSRLIGIAFPSLFTEEEIITGVPSQENAENMDPQIEHSYSRKRHFDHTYCMESLKETSSGSILPESTSGSSDPGTTSGSVVPETSFYSTPSESTGANKKIGPVKSRKRIVRKVTDLTPLGQTIYKEYKKAKQEHVMLKRAKRALKFSKTVAFEKLCKNMNPYAKKIIEMQMNLCTKKNKGYRFSLQEKLIALSILKQSPKG
ncbi:hypothetical protein ACJJTC_000641 [Scirpophaga incertulas]